MKTLIVTCMSTPILILYPAVTRESREEDDDPEVRVDERLDVCDVGHGDARVDGQTIVPSMPLLFMKDTWRDWSPRFSPLDSVDPVSNTYVSSIA